MRTRFVMAVVGTLALSGCAGLNYIYENYQGTPLAEFQNEDDTFRIFDKPQESRLMITPSLGTTMVSGAVSGATFNAVSTAVPKPVYEKAVLGYLQSTGRACMVVDGALLVTPQWEFKYRCDGASIATGSVAPPSRQERP
ncbi:MAG: hypothetical protein AB7J30_13135 [Hyphomicrobium sp.]|uniref:hypothetical protein n=1 Tax=Hyphomicrobium sp. TaxID=82 RepID=UPI003D0AAC42